MLSSPDVEQDETRSLGMVALVTGFVHPPITIGGDKHLIASAWYKHGFAHSM